jgi:hypothetical protein
MSQDSPYGQSPEYGAAPPPPSAEPTTREILTEPAQMNPVSRLVNAVFSPGEMFTDVRRSPRDWFVPILLFVIVASVAGYVAQARFNLTPEIMAAAVVDVGLEQQGKTRKDLTEQEKQGVEMQEKITAFMYQVAPVTAAVVIVITVFVIGGLYRVLTPLLQGRTTFFRCISVAAYAYSIPQSIKWFLHIVLSFIKSPDSVDPVGYIQGGGLIHASPAAFFSAKANPVLFTALSWFDLFSIWFLVLAVIGLSTVCVKKLKPGSAALIVVGPYVLIMLLSIGIAAMFAK